MPRTRTFAILGGVVAVALTAVAVIVFALQRNRLAPALRRHFESGFGASNLVFHLRPVNPEKAGDKARVEQTWRDLFTGMARDPDTQKLLRRLHANLPVEFVVLDEKRAADDALMKAPPSEGFPFVLRVADLRIFKEETAAGEVVFRVIAFYHVTEIKDAVVSDYRAELKEPSPEQALTLAMEDYMLRHAEDWIIGGPIFEEDLKMPAQASERRVDLDRRIQTYTEKANAFYAALRPPKQ